MNEKMLGDEGGFGCVFQPSFPCVRDTEVFSSSKNKHVVGKIFTKKHKGTEVKREIDVSRLVNQWDPKGDYFVVPTSYCKTKTEMVRRHKEADKCTHLQNSVSELLSQLIMPYGGVDLLSYMTMYVKKNQKKFPLDIWIRLLENVIQGLLIMQQHGYLHGDIKAENILYDHIKLKIIDFSLSEKLDSIYTEKRSGLINTEYIVVPLEVILLRKLHYESCHKFFGCSIYGEFMKTIHSFGEETYQSFERHHSLQEISKIIQSMEKQATKKHFFEKIKKNADKLDVYSLGILCIDLDPFFDHSVISPTKQKKYVAFVKKLSALDFQKRPTMKKAYELWKQL
jgi:serine/threonine protein kinase